MVALHQNYSSSKRHSRHVYSGVYLRAFLLNKHSKGKLALLI